MQWNEALYDFYKNLQPPKRLPNNIEWLYPQQSDEVMEIVKQFLNKFYADDKPHKLFLAINPGRFGAGVTGVNFTAPRQLAADCGIEHPFKMQSEISAEFIYDMINAYGGPAAFYRNYFIGSVCPLGFIKDGKNINYYDDKELLQVVEPFIIKSIGQLIQMPFDKDVCYCIGGEKNYKYLSALNKQQGWFQQIVSLPHPRFIMQYKRKQREAYVDLYLKELR